METNINDFAYLHDLSPNGLISFDESRHLMELGLYPQLQHVKAWYVQYDFQGYWPINDYETWSLLYKKKQDSESDYGYSNPIFYPVTTKEFYKDVIKYKEPISDYEMNGIPDYMMNKFNY